MADLDHARLEALITRLRALLPELEYSRETHVQWRDCPQSCRDANPQIGDSTFHAGAIIRYDERIAAINEAITTLAGIRSLVGTDGAHQ